MRSHGRIHIQCSRRAMLTLTRLKSRPVALWSARAAGAMAGDNIAGRDSEPMPAFTLKDAEGLCRMQLSAVLIAYPVDNHQFP